MNRGGAPSFPRSPGRLRRLGMSRSSAGLQVEGNYRAQLNVTRCEKLETGASCPGAAGGSQGHVGGMSRRSPGNQRLPSTLASPIPGKMCGRSVGSVTCQRWPGWLERCSRSLRIPVLLGRRLPAPSGSFSSCFPPLCPPEAGDPLPTLSLLPGVSPQQRMLPGVPALGFNSLLPALRSAPAPISFLVRAPPAFPPAHWEPVSNWRFSLLFAGAGKAPKVGL